MIKFPDFASRGAQPARGGLRQGRAKCVSSDSRTFPALSPRVGFPLPRGVRGLPGLSLSHPDVQRSRGSRGRVTGRGPPHAEPAACAARGPPPRSVGRGPHPARVSLSFPICEPAARSPDARDFRGMRARGAWSRWWRPELALLVATVTPLQVAASSVTGALAEESESVSVRCFQVTSRAGLRGSSCLG